MPRPGLPNYVITGHALFEMKRRGLSEDDVWRVLDSPEQRFGVDPGRVALQSRVMMDVMEKSHLLRVIVDVDRQPPEVVTVYGPARLPSIGG